MNYDEYTKDILLLNQSQGVIYDEQKIYYDIKYISKVMYIIYVYDEQNRGNSIQLSNHVSSNN